MLEFLEQMDNECGLQPGRDIILFTGSGSGFISPLVGGRFIQEVVAVSAAVERLHPQVNFVSEIGGEDMKTIFFTTVGERQEQTSLHAVGLQWRHRNVHRKDRAQTEYRARKSGADELRRLGAAQDKFQMRDFRRSRRQYADQGRRGRPRRWWPACSKPWSAEPGDADQGQHADAGSPVARRAKPVLQGSAASLAPASRRALGGSADDATKTRTR